MNGENLFNAAMIMTKAEDEIEAMLDKLFDLLENKLTTLDDVQKIEISSDDQTSKDKQSVGVWVYTDVVRNIAIYKKKAKKPTAYLAFQIKLCDPKEAEIAGCQPLLYVLFASGENWDINEFLLQEAISSEYELEGDCLWQLYDEDEDRSKVCFWTESVFAFVVPLTSLNTPDDLQAVIVDPIYTLINSGLEPKNLDPRVLRFKVNGSAVQLLS